MVFQYNPLETHLEVTSTRASCCARSTSIVLSPKLRYNIGDEAKLLDFPDLEKLIARHLRHEAGFRRAGVDRMKLPLFSSVADSTVSFMGANIYPQDIEYGPEDNPRAGDIEAFMFTLEEDAELDSRPVVNICARRGAPDDAGRGALCVSLRAGHRRPPTAVSRDFKQSLREDPPLPGSTCASMTSAPDPSRAASPRSRRFTSASRPPKPLHQTRPHEICRLLQGATHRPGGCDVHRRHPLQRHSCGSPSRGTWRKPSADEGDARLLLAHRLLRAAFHLGTIAYFDTRDDLLRIAHRRSTANSCSGSPMARRTPRAATSTLWVAEPDVYTNGIWRAGRQRHGAHRDLQPDPWRSGPTTRGRRDERDRGASGSSRSSPEEQFEEFVALPVTLPRAGKARPLLQPTLRSWWTGEHPQGRSGPVTFLLARSDSGEAVGRMCLHHNLLR